MEINIKLTEAEIDAVSAGTGIASFHITNTPSGTTATVGGTFTMSTTASSVSFSGTFSSSSTQCPNRKYNVAKSRAVVLAG